MYKMGHNSYIVKSKLKVMTQKSNQIKWSHIFFLSFFNSPKSLIPQVSQNYLLCKV